MCMAESAFLPALTCRMCGAETDNSDLLGGVCSPACEDKYADIRCGDGACPECGGIDYPCPCTPRPIDRAFLPLDENEEWEDTIKRVRNRRERAEMIDFNS